MNRCPYHKSEGRKQDRFNHLKQNIILVPGLVVCNGVCVCVGGGGGTQKNLHALCVHLADLHGTNMT